MCETRGEPERANVMSRTMTTATPPIKYNKEKGCNSKAGSKESHGPRLIGEILHELVNTSNEPLYKGYRSYLASKENAEKGGMKHE